MTPQAGAPPPPNTTGIEDRRALIRTAARRVGRFGQSLAEAHEFGTEPGPLEQAWSHEFHRQAAPIYTDALPRPYLNALATSFADCAKAMAIASAPHHLAEEWLIVSNYLHAASGEILSCCADVPPLHEFRLEDRTPSIMPFARIARLVTVEGVVRLANAGTTVAASIGSNQACPLEPTQVAWIHSLANGQRVLDIAINFGYSEREMYRRLKETWSELGVCGRSEAIAVSVRQGWI